MLHHMPPFCKWFMGAARLFKHPRREREDRRLGRVEEEHDCCSWYGHHILAPQEFMQRPSMHLQDILLDVTAGTYEPRLLRAGTDRRITPAPFYVGMQPPSAVPPVIFRMRHGDRPADWTSIFYNQHAWAREYDRARRTYAPQGCAHIYDHTLLCLCGHVLGIVARCTTQHFTDEQAAVFFEHLLGTSSSIARGRFWAHDDTTQRILELACWWAVQARERVLSWAEIYQFIMSVPVFGPAEYYDIELDDAVVNRPAPEAIALAARTLTLFQHHPKTLWWIVRRYIRRRFFADLFLKLITAPSQAVVWKSVLAAGSCTIDLSESPLRAAPTPHFRAMLDLDNDSDDVFLQGVARTGRRTMASLRNQAVRTIGKTRHMHRAHQSPSLGRTWRRVPVLVKTESEGLRRSMRLSSLPHRSYKVDHALDRVIARLR